MSRPLGLHKAKPRGVPPVTPAKLEAWERSQRGESRAAIAFAMRVSVSSVSKYVLDVEEARASERYLARKVAT